MTPAHSLRVDPICAFRDNYIWALTDGRCAAVVDPGDAAPVLAYLAANQVRLVAILATHHHADHVGGIGALVMERAVPVFGPRDEDVPTVTHPLAGGGEAHLPELQLRLRVLDIPGHTRGHIAYYGSNSLFCGDTLFACGCGRLFEGTPPQMCASLAKLAALPDETRVYCGHEYTLANIAFAKEVEPGNAELLAREAEARARRDRGLPTLPSDIGLEKATNPFLRAAHAAVVAAAERHVGRRLGNATEVFAALREWKNAF